MRNPAPKAHTNVCACVRVLKVGSTWDIRTKEGAISQGRGIFVAHLRYQNKRIGSLSEGRAIYGGYLGR